MGVIVQLQYPPSDAVSTSRPTAVQGTGNRVPPEGQRVWLRTHPGRARDRRRAGLRGGRGAAEVPRLRGQVGGIRVPEERDGRAKDEHDVLEVRVAVHAWTMSGSRMRRGASRRRSWRSCPLAGRPLTRLSWLRSTMSPVVPGKGRELGGQGVLLSGGALDGGPADPQDDGLSGGRVAADSRRARNNYSNAGHGGHGELERLLHVVGAVLSRVDVEVAVVG